jgi:hypothetical protein
MRRLFYKEKENLCADADISSLMVRYQKYHGLGQHTGPNPIVR